MSNWVLIHGFDSNCALAHQHISPDMKNLSMLAGSICKPPAMKMNDKNQVNLNFIFQFLLKSGKIQALKIIFRNVW